MTRPLLTDEDVCVFCFKRMKARIRVNVIGRALPLCEACVRDWHQGGLSLGDMKERFAELKSMGMMA